MRVTFCRTLTEPDLERGIFEAVGVWVIRLKESGASVQVYDCEYGHLTMAIGYPT